MAAFRMVGQSINRPDIPWGKFEHQLHELFTQFGVKDRNVVVALSGGADSVALLKVVLKIASSLELSITCVHVHHGESSNKLYRQKAALFCEQLCADFNIKFHLIKNNQQTLNAEEELREFRWQHLRHIKESLGERALILTAHHQDDLIEGQFIRLWRGTGPEGLISFKCLQEDRFRPFLSFSKAELIQYLQEQGQSYLEDPSNQDSLPLRNFIRQELFPMMEKRAPGGLAALARSFSLIGEAIEQQSHNLATLLQSNPPRVARPVYLSLSPGEKQALIAKMLLYSGVQNFTAGQVLEIFKRLENATMNYEFTLAQQLKTKVWKVDAKQISLLDK